MDLVAGTVPGPVLIAGFVGLLMAVLAWRLSASDGSPGVSARGGASAGAGAVLLLAGVAVVAVAALIGGRAGQVFAGSGARPAPATACPAPAFALGIASLRARLGDTMGEPLECEHADPESGDALQQTSTGLAYYRRATNTAAFTDGFRHWALTADGLVRWEGDSVDPPAAGAPPAAPPPSARPRPAAAPPPAAQTAPAPSGDPPEGAAIPYLLVAGLLAAGLGSLLLVRAWAARARRLRHRPWSAEEAPRPDQGAVRYLEHENVGWEMVGDAPMAKVDGPLCPSDRARLLYLREGSSSGLSELVRGDHRPGGVHGHLWCPTCHRAFTFSARATNVAAVHEEVLARFDGRRDDPGPAEALAGSAAS